VGWVGMWDVGMIRRNEDARMRGCEDAKIERVALFVKLIFIFIIIFR
jgi:hypothetical protein